VVATRSTERFDALDAEAFDDMLLGKPFGVFMDRVHQALRTAEGDCYREDEELNVRRAQGRVAALRMVAELPAMIKSDMRKGHQ
jgi:hypothetical protein